MFALYVRIDPDLRAAAPFQEFEKSSDLFAFWQNPSVRGRRNVRPGICAASVESTRPRRAPCDACSATPKPRATRRFALWPRFEQKREPTWSISQLEGGGT